MSIIIITTTVIIINLQPEPMAHLEFQLPVVDSTAFLLSALWALGSFNHERGFLYE